MEGVEAGLETETAKAEKGKKGASNRAKLN